MPRTAVALYDHERANGCNLVMFVFSRGRYWQCIWQPGDRLRSQPVTKATVVFLRHSRICIIRGYGSVLPDDGLPHPVCILAAETEYIADR